MTTQPALADAVEALEHAIGDLESELAPAPTLRPRDGFRWLLDLACAPPAASSTTGPRPAPSPARLARLVQALVHALGTLPPDQRQLVAWLLEPIRCELAPGVTRATPPPGSPIRRLARLRSARPHHPARPGVATPQPPTSLDRPRPTLDWARAAPAPPSVPGPKRTLPAAPSLGASATSTPAPRQAAASATTQPTAPAPATPRPSTPPPQGSPEPAPLASEAALASALAPRANAPAPPAPDATSTARAASPAPATPAPSPAPGDPSPAPTTPVPASAWQPKPVLAAAIERIQHVLQLAIAVESDSSLALGSADHRAARHPRRAPHHPRRAALRCPARRPAQSGHSLLARACRPPLRHPRTTPPCAPLRKAPHLPPLPPPSGPTRRPDLSARPAGERPSPARGRALC